MNICHRCNGTGYQEYEEDNRLVQDGCYHCGTTGEVDAETAYHDQLGSVAHRLAYNYVSELKRARNSDPEGEGWDFCAAENMMSGVDYFYCHIMTYEDQFMKQLLELPKDKQEVLIAWHQYHQDEMKKCRDTVPHVPSFIQTMDTDPYNLNMDVGDADSDNLLF
jgi:hypothetical protein